MVVDKKESLVSLKVKYPKHEKDFYIETVLTYKTKDGYTGHTVKIRSKGKNDKK